MAPASSQGAPGRLRRFLRRSGFVVIFLLIFTVGGMGYLNVVGLPDFIKRPLIRQLEARGLALKFDTLRLHWGRGLVAEHVVLEGTPEGEGPQIEFDEVTLEPDWGKLAMLEFQLRSLELREGVLAVPLDLPDQSIPPFQIKTAQAELRFLPEDRWELVQLSAQGLGVQVHASGFLTNASAVGSWTRGAARRDRATLIATWQDHLRRITASARAWDFSRPPVLNLLISGDARDPAKIRAELVFDAQGIKSPWVELQTLSLKGELNRETGTAGLGRSEVKAEFQQARTAWGSIGHGRWALDWSQGLTNPLPAEVDWQVSLDQVESPWGETPRVELSLRAYPRPEFPDQLVGEISATSDTILGGLVRADTNRLTARVWLDPVSFLPSMADYQFTAANAWFEDGTARLVDLHGRMQVRNPKRRVAIGANWGWWASFEPFEISGEGRIDGLQVRAVNFDSVQFLWDWKAPRVRVTQLRIEQGGGEFNGTGSVDVGTRKSEATATMNLDAHSLGPFLTPKTVLWLSRYGWVQPPRVEAVASVTLPEWGDTHPDWRGEVLPTLHLKGRVEAGPASFRGVQADAVELQFQYSNRVWHLPDLVATRPEGKIEFSYTEDTSTRDFQFHGRSEIDPQALLPLLQAKAQKGLNLFQFTLPPRVTGDIEGRWHDAERTAFQADVQAAAFEFREEPIDEFTVRLQLADQYLSATNVQLRTGDEVVSAPGIGFQFQDQLLMLTNVTARIDPLKVARGIGAKTVEILSPYRFLEPPNAQVDGSINVRDVRSAHLRFVVSGGPFHYWRFRVPEIAATVGWTNANVTISQLTAPFYRGKLESQIRVDVGRVDQTPFQFEARVARADFHELLSDLQSPTNQAGGQLSVDLAITHADGRDWQSWQGFGQADLLNGFLWDIPMVGIFSPALNAILPGVGKSRISGASGTFSITNSIVHTDDLEMRSPFFRLAYRGSVDLDGRVKARVEARFLRDAWVIGPLVSLMFSPLSKVFEYEVTGTLNEPHLELMYIPKPLQAPFNPLGILREMFQEKPSQIPPPQP